MKLDLTKEQSRQFGEWLKSYSNLKQRVQQSVVQGTIAMSEDNSGNAVLTFSDNIGELLKDNDQTVRLQALNYLLERGGQSDIAPVNDIVNRLSDESREVREAVLKNLDSFIYKIDDALRKKIIRLLWDKNPGIREAGVRALTVIGIDADDGTLDEIISLTKDIDTHVRKAAVCALRGFSDDLSSTTICEIIKMLKVDDLHSTASEFLNDIGGQLNDNTVVEICGYLRDEDSEMRALVAEFLCQIGQEDLVQSCMPEHIS